MSSYEELSGGSWKYVIVIAHHHSCANLTRACRSFTVPGAKKFFIGFHEETNCHRNRSVVRIYKRGEEDGEALWEGSGIASKFPGGKNPPLVVHGDSFSVTFLSRNAPGTDWGYRLVAWSSGPKGWCRFAELMLSESKEAGRLCMALIKVRRCL